MRRPGTRLTRRSVLVGAGALFAGCGGTDPERAVTTVTPAPVPLSRSGKLEAILTIEQPTTRSLFTVDAVHVANVRSHVERLVSETEVVLDRTAQLRTSRTERVGDDRSTVTTTGNTTPTVSAISTTATTATDGATPDPHRELQVVRQQAERQISRSREWLGRQPEGPGHEYILEAGVLVSNLGEARWYLQARAETLTERPDPRVVGDAALAFRDGLEYRCAPEQRGALLVRFRALEDALSAAIDRVDRWEPHDVGPGDEGWPQSVGTAGAIFESASRQLADAEIYRREFDAGTNPAPFDLSGSRRTLQTAVGSAYAEVADEFTPQSASSQPYEVLGRAVPGRDTFEDRLELSSNAARAGREATAVIRLAEQLVQYRAVAVARDRFAVDPTATTLPIDVVMAEKRTAVDRLGQMVEATANEPLSRELLEWGFDVLSFGDRSVGRLVETSDDGPTRNGFPLLPNAYLGYLVATGTATVVREVAALAQGART